jgi:hypothetical protein
MTLKLVPPRLPTQKEAIIQRIKRRRPDGAIMCNKCGGMAMMTIRSGAYIHKGRITGGTIIEKNICALCWKRGIWSPMLPELRPVK